jgi:hypothetical protein
VKFQVKFLQVKESERNLNGIRTEFKRNPNGIRSYEVAIAVTVHGQAGSHK